MDAIWKEMYDAAKAVQSGRRVSEYVEAGGVAAAILSESGKIYTGVCVDTACTLGICAERNAVFHMLTCGEQKIARVLALMPDGRTGAPCGACREMMAQLMPAVRASASASSAAIALISPIGEYFLKITSPSRSV